MNQLSAMTATSPKHFWWVNQNQTFEHEFQGGYPSKLERGKFSPVLKMPVSGTGFGPPQTPKAKGA